MVQYIGSSFRILQHINCRRRQRQISIRHTKRMFSFHSYAIRFDLRTKCFSATNGHRSLWLALPYMFGLPWRRDYLRTKFWRSLLESLGEVFGRLRKANLKLKPSKCSLCQRSVKFLGQLSEDGTVMQDEKIAAIRDWPPCRNVTEVRAFVELSGYYRCFVKDFSVAAAPLYGFIKKGVEFVWTNECQEAFDELKRRLVSGPILALPKNEGT